MLTESVTYKQVEGYPDYWVGDDGTVWSAVTNRFLKPVLLSIGYLQIALGRKRRVYIHRLLYETFVGPCEHGKHIRHLNDNRLDNRLCNLAIGSAADNCSDARRNGRIYVGSERYNAKLDNDKALEIAGLKHKVRSVEVAKRFGISRQSVNDIWARRTWRHVS